MAPNPVRRTVWGKVRSRSGERVEAVGGLCDKRGLVAELAVREG